jgi:hypothetical protein
MAHRLFSIPELCDCITEVVPDYEEGLNGAPDPKGPHRQTLLALALVSRMFKDPALNILWKRLPDFSPIARLFPRHAVTMIKRGDLWDTVNAMDGKLWFRCFSCQIYIITTHFLGNVWVS